MPTTPTANSISSLSPSRSPEHDHKLPLSPSSKQGRRQDVSTSRPSKKQRPSRHANMAAGRASPSSDSSSQSGMAGNDTEAEPSQLTEPSDPQLAPPKKKRTRTLTTPHQSEVLHALLAKSRFPTTAMREEVGRQIGLSARKVQIWFQNQRQKARRPQSESAPLSRPPQFGPFPIITTPGPSYPSPSAGGPAAELSPTGPSSARSAASFDSNPPLSGPGMPGCSSSSLPRRHSSAEDRDPPPRALTSPRLPPGKHALSPRSSDGISTRDARVTARGRAPHPAPQATHVEISPHFSRVLPPITLSPLEQRNSTEPCVAARSPFPPPSSRSFVNTVQRPDTSTRPLTEPGGTSSLLAIPPPFALQPQPQWDPHAFTPFTRPEFASWSHPSGSARSSFSAVGAHDLSPRRRHFYTSSEPRRSGQLDSPLPRHIIPPSRDDRHPASASSSRASASGHGHARSDDSA